MMTVEDTRYAATMAWIEQVVAASPKLQATRHEFYTLNGQLWVKVEGAHWETHAWHAAVGGLIRPSYVDGGGVRRQMVFGIRVHVEVIDDPRRHTQDGRINVGVALIVGFVGLFLWGFAHGSRTPNGAWVAAVAVVGAVVLLLSGAHYWDGA